MRKFLTQSAIFWIFSLFAASLLAVLVTAGTVKGDTIQDQITAKNSEIAKLEQEAAAYQKTLTTLSTQAHTLANEVKSFDTAIAKLSVTIKATNAKIAKANLEIKILSQNISTHEQVIQADRLNLASLVASLGEIDQESMLEVMMKNSTLSDFFASVDRLSAIQGGVTATITTLRTERQDLQDQQGQVESKRKQLTSLARDLNDQQQLQATQRLQRSSLLAQTKNQEQKYQQLLVDTAKRRTALQQELNDLQSRLSQNFDRSHIPASGAGVLSWPLPSPIYITQYFGNTEFAQSGAYNGKGHNGIDLRAPNGTTVFAAEGGVVRATGDTDLGCPRASYGRWVLIDHPNGLSTLYGHLSLIKVSSGDTIHRGDLIAYSGQTGYATGPHLHFTVLVSTAATVTQYRSKVCGRNMTLPVSPFSGYINPIDYLGSSS